MLSRRTLTGLLAAMLLCLLLAGCAGKGSSQPPPATAPVTQPTTSALTITTTGTLAPGTFGQFYQTNLKASGGTPPYQWFAMQGDPLSAGLTLDGSGELSGVLTDQLQLSVEVADARKKSVMANIIVPLTQSAVKIITSVLPPATVNQPYAVTIQCNQRFNACNFALQGSAPPGLSLSQANLTGTPTATGQFTFVVSATAATGTAQQTYTLQVSDKQPRNDTFSSATLISNGTWYASISPYHDASSSGPDEDFFALTAPGGSYVSVNIFAQRINSPMQPVLEIIGPNGGRFVTCETGFCADVGVLRIDYCSPDPCPMGGWCTPGDATRHGLCVTAF